MMPIDAPVEVRPGDELDPRMLEPWLLGHLPGAHGPLRVRQFPHGHSNLNYLIELGGVELVLRRPPAGASAHTAHDVGREYRLLASLFPVWGAVPEPLAYCPDSRVIGAPFHVTRRVRGTILRHTVPAAAELGDGDFATLAQSFVAQLAALHRIDVQLAGLGDFGRPQGYALRQVEGWSRRYQAARTADSPDLTMLTRWLRRRRPPEAAAALIHNDYRYDNLVLDPAQPTRVLAVLDWEMATLADPQLDLGAVLAHWMEAGDATDLQELGITHLPGNPDRETLVAMYAAQSGRPVADPVFLFAFGLLRLIGVLQQVYARFRRGETHDPRYARFIGLVHDAAELAARAIRHDRISRLG
jgi:aminoglycoside phosphotransferase (APT) family kinase protein